MNKTNKMLAAVAAGQLVLMVLTWSLASTIGGAAQSEPLLDISADDVTSMTITSPEKDGKTPPPITLEKKGDDWVVGTAEGYPADNEKVGDLVKKIAGLKVRESLANNKGNHAVLKVSADSFDKKVSLKADGKTIDLFMGSAKGSSVNARLADKDEVFLARGVSAYAISERPSLYVDTSYLKVEDPTAVTVKNAQGTINLTNTLGAGWKVAQLPPDADVDESRVKAFVNSAQNVVLADPVGKTVKPEFGLDNGTRVEVTDAKGTRAYTIGAERDGKFYVKADDNDFVVLVAKYAVETLRTQVPNKFIKEAAAPVGAPGAPGAPGGPGGGISPEMLEQIMKQQQMQMQPQ